MNNLLNEDAACFADALEAFADLSPSDQTALIADLRVGEDSTPEINTVRHLIAEAVRVKDRFSARLLYRKRLA